MQGAQVWSLVQEAEPQAKWYGQKKALLIFLVERDFQIQYLPYIISPSPNKTYFIS